FSHPPALTKLSPLSLHDALPILAFPERLMLLDPISGLLQRPGKQPAEMYSADFPTLDQPGPLEHREVLGNGRRRYRKRLAELGEDRKSTRLNSSHLGISYAVFCL